MAVPSVHERLLMTVTGNPGTGAVTVNTAVSGFQAFVAGDDGNKFDVVIYSVDSNGNPNGLWEVQAQSAYTNATTSLARSAGNVVDGSSGAGVLVNFASGTQRVADVLSTAGVQVIRQTGGTAGTNECRISHDGNQLVLSSLGTSFNGGLLVQDGSGNLFFQTNNTSNTSIIRQSFVSFSQTAGQTNFRLDSTGFLWLQLDLRFVSGSGTRDSGIRRLAANVVAPSDGTNSGAGWLQQIAGEGALAANFTNATATMAATNLSYNVIAGRSYRITGVLQVSNSTAGEGIQFDFNGGSATATTFFAEATINGTAVAGTLTTTTLAGVINWTSITGTDYIRIDGYLKVNAGGTLILRAAENTHTTGTLTIGAGSWIALRDTVNL